MVSKKLVPISYFFWVQIWIPIFWDLGCFGCLLGSYFGLLRLFLEASVAKNVEKTIVFFKVFVNEGFWFFEAPDGSFGLILALLGHSDPKMGSKMSFNIFLKSF